MHDQTDADMMQNKAGSTFAAFECDLFQDSEGKMGYRSHMAFLTKNDSMYEFEKSRHCIGYRVGLFMFFMFHFMFHPSLGQFPHFGSWLILNNFFRRSFQDIGIFLVVTEHCEQTSHDE